MKKVIPVSRLSRGEDKPTDKPTPGLLGTMAGGAAVSSFHNMIMVDGRADGMLGLSILVEIFESAMHTSW